MFTIRNKQAGMLLLGLGLLIPIMLLFGCSGQSPAEPEADPAVVDLPLGTAPPDNQVQFSTLIATMDVATLTLTFTGSDYVAIASDDCLITRIVDGVMVPITFEELLVGDSVKVCGLLQDDGSVLANRIRVYGTGDCMNYDVAFRAAIATIDYAGMSFTVEGHDEVILVDENTLIWAVLGCQSNAASETDLDGDGPNGPHNYERFRDTILTFTDLNEGDVVEVKALIEDPATLRAVSIKVAGESYRLCVRFDATLASVDVDGRIVTFDALSWIGWVCPNAVLADAAGTTLTLADFSAGDMVAVKGFPMEGDSLKICVMTQLE